MGRLMLADSWRGPWSKEYCPRCGRGTRARYVEEYGWLGVEIETHFTWSSRWCLWSGRTVSQGAYERACRNPVVC